MQDLSSLEEKLGVEFDNEELLRQALTHRSYINENPDFELDHNERLEFLGDAVLELITTDYLYRNHPKPEGVLTNWRSALVRSEMLAKVANNLEMEDKLLLSKGERKDKGRGRRYIMGNAVEAIIGAIYLDQGYEAAEEFVDEYILAHLDDVLEKRLYKDPKSLFQEEAQDRLDITPTYEALEAKGPDHKKEFKVGVYLEDDLVTTGKGFSKQAAQEEAAKKALDKKSWGDKQS